MTRPTWLNDISVSVLSLTFKSDNPGPLTRIKSSRLVGRQVRLHLGLGSIHVDDTCWEHVCVYVYIHVCMCVYVCVLTWWAGVCVCVYA